MYKRFIYILLLLQSTCIYGVTEKDIPIHPYKLNKSDKRSCELSLSAIFRDEGPYLKEWIEYHKLLGVGHFYLYNNLSEDNFQEVLNPYIEDGTVELFNVPFDSYLYSDCAKTHNLVQISCYNHSLRLTKNISKWLAIIDTDEFICPVIDPDILTALERYKKFGGIVVYWQIYGTSNIWDLKPNELLIEKLVYKEPEKGGNPLYKSIVKPKYALRARSPHFVKMQSNKPMMFPNFKKYVDTPNFTSLPIDIIRINHYTYRTLSYYYNFKKPRRKRWGFNPSKELEKEFLNSANSVHDPIMLKFVPDLKKALKK